MILFSDPGRRRGGGQVVLEELLRRLSEFPIQLGLVVPDPSQPAIDIPSSVIVAPSAHKLIQDNPQIHVKEIVFVANNNRGFPGDLLQIVAIRSKIKVKAVALLHSYPSSVFRTMVVRQSLRQFDITIGVEPGLRTLDKRMEIAPWLAPIAQGLTLPVDQQLIVPTHTIKVFARPDPSKGLQLLPEVFRQLSSVGFNCHVSLGHSLVANGRFIENLKNELAPWLEKEYKTSDWIEPGDIFLAPSIAGETACLAAQEAMLHGAFVVSSSIGIFPYLMPTKANILSVQTGNSRAVVDGVMRVISMPEKEFSERIHSGVAILRNRSGAWYDYVISRLLELDRAQ